MTKVKVAIYRDRKVVGVLGYGLTRTTREIWEGDLSDDDLKTLKRMLEGGRK